MKNEKAQNSNTEEMSKTAKTVTAFLAGVAFAAAYTVVRVSAVRLADAFNG